MTNPFRERAIQCAEAAHEAIADSQFPEALALGTLALFWQKEAELYPTNEYLRERTEQAKRMALEVAEWVEKQR